MDKVHVTQVQAEWVGFMVGERRMFRISDQGVIEIYMTNSELLDLWHNGPDQQSKMFACVLMQLKTLQKRVYGDNHLLIAEDMRGLFGKLHRGHSITEIQ